MARQSLLILEPMIIVVTIPQGADVGLKIAECMFPNCAMSIHFKGMGSERKSYFHSF